jgi:hypothetical protein
MEEAASACSLWVALSQSPKNSITGTPLNTCAHNDAISSTFQFPNHLLGCKLRFRFGRAVIGRHEVMYRHARLATPNEDPWGNCRAPMPRFSLIGDNRIFGEMRHRETAADRGIGLTGRCPIVLIEQQKRSAQPQA